jgi:tRNA-dihydrouridine synthase B
MPLPFGRNYPWLAPLAGYSDLPFRILCRELGATAACTEMVSARGLICGLKRRSDKGRWSGLELLRTHPADDPLVVQLFGAEPEYVAAAARELAERGYRYFDLNMGCPAPKVTKSGAGAALLRDPERAALVARALFRAVGEGRAGCKLRLGADAASPVYLELGQRLADEGAAWLTLHPRHGKQGFAGTADIKAVELLAGRVNIPVLASGDIFRAEDAARYLDLGATGVMFGRGALADPFIFRKFLALSASGSEKAGPDGALSAQAAPSATGSMGVPDAMGAPGALGTMGAPGATGAPGAKGAMGAPGAPDTMGAPSAKGAMGAKAVAYDEGAEQWLGVQSAPRESDAMGASCGEGAEQALGALLRHAHLARTLLPAPVEGRIPPALLRMRSIAPRYLRNAQGIKRLRMELIRCRTWEEFYAALRGFFPACPWENAGEAGPLRKFASANGTMPRQFGGEGELCG